MTKNQKAEIKNLKSSRPHPLLKEWQKLGMSWREGAEESGIPRSTLYGFLHGLKRFGERKNPEPLIRAYIESKTPSLKINSKPMLRKLYGSGIGIKEAANALNLKRADLYRYLALGKWPNVETLDAFNKYLEEKKSKGVQKMLTKISLSQEILDHWGLKRDPFTNEMEGVEDIIDTKDLARAEKKMMTAVDKNGWVAVTGPVGCGKSILVKKFEGRLARRKEVLVVKPRTIEKQYLGATHVCDSILQDLGTQSILTHRTLEYKARLVGRTLEEARRDGKKIVIVIDEAHLLRPEALLALKRIYEFEVGFKKLLSIILVGQTLLARQLQTNFTLAEVSQRVDLFEIGSLNGAIGSYVRHKLERAGMNGKDIFETSSIKAIQERADTPLGVNNLAAAAMSAACDLAEKRVTGEIVRGIQGSV